MTCSSCGVETEGEAAQCAACAPVSEGASFDDNGERQIEMTWRCGACQHQNLGRHKTCQQCGDPKDDSEAYEMPADVESAPSVTDEALLRMAVAGPDWKCAYCGSDQRRLDSSCARCGASAATGIEPVYDEASPPKPPRGKLLRNVLVVSGLGVGLASGFVWNARRPRDYDAKVTAVSWEHTIDVERYAIRSHEGFKEQLPSGALEVTSLGQRVHHQESVFDHNEDVRYSVEVPDGYRTETYSASESCGQTCTTRPRSCSQSCSSRKNGFASCRQVCTGGGQSCSTKYCTVMRTRQVPRTRTEWRTRQEARYRQEPRYAEAFAYKAWEWAPDRTTRETGTDATLLKWPAGAKTLEAMPSGEQEREHRHGKYVVTIQYNDDSLVKFEVATPEEFARFATGSEHEVHREPDVLLVDGAPIKQIP